MSPSIYYLKSFYLQLGEYKPHLGDSRAVEEKGKKNIREGRRERGRREDVK
jgi:hypothetical protein